MRYVGTFISPNRRPPRVPFEVIGRSHFWIERAAGAWSITIRRGTAPAEIIPAASMAEALRKTRPLSDAGLVGYVASQVL